MKTLMRFTVLSASCALLASALAASAGADDGRRLRDLNLDGQNFTPAFDTTKYAYKSDQGGIAGQSDPDWQPAGLWGGDVRAIAIAPSNPDIMLAGLGIVGALYRSTDAGATWAAIPDVFSSPLAGGYSATILPDGTAYAGTTEGVWRSTDFGAPGTWEYLPGPGVGGNDWTYAITVNPDDPTEIWIGMDDHLGANSANVVMRSTDGGQTWLPWAPPGVGSYRGYSIEMHPNDPEQVYVGFGGWAGGGAVWHTPDSGWSWFDISSDLPDHPVRRVIHDGSRLLAALGHTAAAGGLYESTDNGDTWIPLHDETWPSLLINDVAVSPHDSNLIYVAAGAAGAYRSTDGGKTWELSINGAEGMSLQTVAFHPTDASRIYLGSESLGFFTSADSGATFVSSSTGMNRLDVHSVAVNPADPNELAASYNALNSGGILTSTDGGSTWHFEAANPGPRWNRVTFGYDGTLYGLSDGPASVAPPGVFRRGAGGEWSHIGPLTDPPHNQIPFTLRTSPHDPNLLLLGGRSNNIADGLVEVIWRSDDNGETWTKVHVGGEFFSFKHVEDIAMVDDGTGLIWLATSEDETAAGGPILLRSTNAGVTWLDSGTGLPADFRGSGFAVSPSDPMTLYLGNRDQAGGLWFTNNGGLTWSSTGWTESRVDDIVVDPNDGQTIYFFQQRIAGPVTPPRVRKSTDGGATFEVFENGIEETHVARALTLVGGPSPRLIFGGDAGAYVHLLRRLGDLNGDGSVGVPDLLILLAAWGPCPDPNACPADLDGNGIVGVPDLLILLANWG